MAAGIGSFGDLPWFNKNSIPWGIAGAPGYNPVLDDCSAR